MNKLKIGLLIDSYHQPEWIRLMIELIIKSNHSEICLIVKKENTFENKSLQSRVQKINFKILFYSFYKKFENKLYKSQLKAFETKDLTETLKQIPLIKVNCIQTKHTDSLNEEDVNIIKKEKLDVLIRLGFRILKGSILSASKYGVWSLHHGDSRTNRGGPAGVWEFLKKQKDVGSILQILSEDLDNGLILYRSWSSRKNSINKTLNNYYIKTSFFIPRKLEELNRIGGNEFMKKVQIENNDLTFYSERLYKAPTNFEFIKLITLDLLGKIKNKLNSLYYNEQWILMYNYNHSKQLATSLYKFKEIIPPKDRFWADPFVIKQGGEFFVFFEECIKGKKGTINVGKLNKEGNLFDIQTIIEKNYHLSYPFIFSYENKFWIIPESKENKTIEIYECENFPYEWKFKTNLMENVNAVDTTLYFDNYRWWMFTNISENEGISDLDELHIFYKQDLFTGNWNKHTNNPVITDVKSARPAGKIFKFNNEFYRPSQDSSLRYGYALNFNKLITLTENQYVEKKTSTIYPNWNDKICGVHTFSNDEEMTVIDARIKQRKFFN